MKRLVIGIFAHPDDEGFGPSGTLLLETNAGSELHLICATCGEAGQNVDGHGDLGAVRQDEWRAAGKLLGATSMIQLGYPDGKLCNDLYLEIASKIIAYIEDLLSQQTEIVELSF